MDMPRAATMNELAKLAGVSISTVSRALAGNPVINQQTREKVEALAREHGFQPNMLARNLRLRRSETIGVVVPLGHQADQHLTDPFFLTLIGHLADELAQRGYDMLLKKIVPRDDQWLRRLAESGRVDGIIVIGQSDQEAALEMVARTYAPMVVWGASLPDQKYVTVGSDNFAGGALATRHLIANGRKRLIFLGDARPPEISQREAGFRLACDEAGLGATAHSLRVGLVGEHAYRELLGIIDVSAGVDGIVAASDVIAIAAIRALQARGFRVPHDVAVVGYDDVPLAEHVVPALTTVRQDLEVGARTMIAKLFALIAGEPQTRTVLDPQLIVRQSS